MVLRKIFGPQKDEKTGSGDGEDYNSDHVKKNEMGGACGTYWGGRGACRGLVGRSDGKNQLENLFVDGKMILKWIFKKREREAWADLA
jgi:hypothetical protein